MNIKLKIAASILIIMSFVWNSVSAQSADTVDRLKNSNPEERAQMQTELMKSRLILTDTQYTQVSAINLKYARKIEPIMKSDAGKFSKYRQIKPLMEAKDEELKAVLTSDQFKKYNEIKKETRSKARNYKDEQ